MNASTAGTGVEAIARDRSGRREAGAQRGRRPAAVVPPPDDADDGAAPRPATGRLDVLA